MSASAMFKLVAYLCVLVLMRTAILCRTGESRQRKALVLGGNGFMGSEAVLRLAAEGFQIITCNRGNWYWDSPVRVKPKVHRQFPCDREDGLQRCWEFRNYVREEVDHFDVVIDFTGYSAEQMADAGKSLDGKVGLYLFISTDSIYMVTRRDQETDENRPWKEEDAVRPTSTTVRERLRLQDPYGHDKLSCEEALAKEHQKRGFPYVAFRLPDVIGQRDTTNRWWPYQIWMQFYSLINIPITFSDKSVTLRTSYVYVHDVIDGLMAVIQRNSSDVWNRAYNLAFDEPLSIEELLQTARQLLAAEEVQLKRLPPEVDVEDSAERIPGILSLLPSVTFGSVNTSRAQRLLGWRPTPLKKALQETVDFYRRAFVTQPLQRKKALSSVVYMLPEEQQASFRAAIEQEIKKAELQEQQGDLKPEDQGDNKDEL